MLLNSWYNYGINQKTWKKWSKILEKYHVKILTKSKSAQDYPIFMKQVSAYQQKLAQFFWKLKRRRFYYLQKHSSEGVLKKSPSDL